MHPRTHRFPSRGDCFAVVRDVERLDYDDMYEISEVQGARHARLQRMVEPGDMEALGDAIRGPSPRCALV